MASLFSATTEGEEALTAATTETVIALIGATQVKAKIVEFGVSFDSTSATADSLNKILTQGEGPVRLILGYAGWAAGQLEREMKEGSWLVLKAKIEHILQTEPSRMWKTVIQELGIDISQLAPASGVH